MLNSRKRGSINKIADAVKMKGKNEGLGSLPPERQGNMWGAATQRGVIV